MQVLEEKKILDEFKKLKEGQPLELWNSVIPGTVVLDEAGKAAAETRPSGFDWEGDLQPQAKRGHCSMKRIPGRT